MYTFFFYLNLMQARPIEPMYSMRNSSGHICVFCQVFLVASTILMGVWMGVYRAGYDWNGTPEQQFSYHPLFMYIGLIFLYGNGQQNSDIIIL